MTPVSLARLKARSYEAESPYGQFYSIYDANAGWLEDILQRNVFKELIVDCSGN